MRLLFLSALFCFAAFRINAQIWTHVTPVKTTTNIRGCSFTSPTKGWAVGDIGGYVIKTSNAGVDWFHVWTPSISGGLYGVWFTANDTGFVCGATGALYKTSDDGANWTTLTSNTTQYLYNLYFLSGSTGFACGFNGTLIKTTNAGTTWTVQTTNTTQRLYDMCFVSASTGFVCGYGGTIIETTDGGTTWTTLTTGVTTNFQSIYFTSATVGYAVGAGGVIIKTIDGGTTWNQLTSGTLQQLYDVNFTSANTGYAFGALGTYLQTNNAGASWTFNTVGGNDLYCSSWVNSSLAYLMGAARIYKTVNSGGTWLTLKIGVPNSQINSICFSSASNAVAVGSVAGVPGNNRSCIIHSTDGGVLWNTAYQNSSSATGLYGVHFPNTTTGFAVGSTNDVKTVNSGTTWSWTTPFSFATRCVFYSNTSVGYVGGGNFSASICKTTNGGGSYTCQTVPCNQIDAFCFPRPDTGYAVGDLGLILKTTNAGVTWNTVLNNTSSLFLCVYFANDSVGYAAGQSGAMRKTTNFGSTWSVVTGVGSSDIVGLYFPTQDSGYALNSSGYLLKTIDGGINWTSLTTPDNTMQPMFCAFFADSVVYGGSNLGELYRTRIPGAQVVITSSNLPADENEITDAQVFPNPFSTSTTIKIPNTYFDAGNSSMIVYDSYGRKTGEVKIESAEFEIDRGNLAQGIYFFQIISGEKIISMGKFVVE